MWPTAEGGGGGGEVDVVDAQRSQLGDRGAVQQSEQADDGFMGMQVRGVGGPSAKQLTLAARF